MPTSQLIQTLVPFATYNNETYTVALGYQDSNQNNSVEMPGLTASGLYIISNEDVFTAGTVTLDIELVDTGWGNSDLMTKTAIVSILDASPPITVHSAAGYHVTVFSAETSLEGVDRLIDHPLPPNLLLTYVFDANDHEFAAAAYFVEQGRSAI